MADIAETGERTGEEAHPEPRKRRRTYFREHPRAKWWLLAALLVVAAAGYFVWRYYSVRESTDDAQIDAYTHQVSAKVGGRVERVYVIDNQTVKAGEVLVQIDPRDYQAALDHARADLASSQADLRAAQSGVPITATTTASRQNTADAGVQAANAGLAASEKEVAAAGAQLDAAQARLREAEARNALAQADLARMKMLIEKDEISRQQYDAAVSEARSTAAGVDAAKAAVANAQQGVQVAQSHVAQSQAALAQAHAAVQAATTAPQEVAVSRAQSGAAQAKVELAQATLAQAELNLQYTTVTAPIDGVTGNRSVQLGEVIQAGQPLMAVVPIEDIWVTANFKETQLKNMRPGQPAIISVDAYGGREYRGHIESIAPATGARFSLLPPENATGNYVKVVQRVPVRIRIEKGQDPEHLLRPGMSVIATVITQ
jgi:membrane fusion protein (multidrug efflux system)